MPIVKSFVNVKNPAPAIAKIIPANSRSAGRFLYAPHTRKGTKTTFVAVRNALLDSVENFKPIVCNVNARNKHSPMITPAITSCFKTLCKLLRAAKNIMIDARKKRTAIICIGVNAVNARSTARNPAPHNMVADNNPTTPKSSLFIIIILRETYNLSEVIG